jgi:hypothetical protein
MEDYMQFSFGNPTPSLSSTVPTHLNMSKIQVVLCHLCLSHVSVE